MVKASKEDVVFLKSVGFYDGPMGDAPKRRVVPLQYERDLARAVDSKDQPYSPEDRAVLLKLCCDIDALSDKVPMDSRTARTHRGAAHIVFGALGVVADGDVVPVVCVDAAAAAQMVLDQVTACRAGIDGPADLVWRRLPELTRTPDGIKLTVRLCFEPSLTRVAHGVWVETRLAESDVNG